MTSWRAGERRGLLKTKACVPGGRRAVQPGALVVTSVFESTQETKHTRTSKKTQPNESSLRRPDSLFSGETTPPIRWSTQLQLHRGPFQPSRPTRRSWTKYLGVIGTSKNSPNRPHQAATYVGRESKRLLLPPPLPWACIRGFRVRACATATKLSTQTNPPIKRKWDENARRGSLGGG